MPRLPIIAAALLSLVTLTARAADPPPEAEAPPASEPAVVVEPPGTEPTPAATPPPPAATPAAPVATTVAATTPAPVPPLKPDRHGLALLVGFGIPYSFLGGQARYDIPVRRSLTVSPFVAAGLLGLLAGPVGASTALGGRHRLVCDLAVAPMGRTTLYLHGTPVEGSMVYGPTAGIGYEHMSGGGWLQRATIGYGYAAWGSTLPITGPHILFLSFGFGWRIW